MASETPVNDTPVVASQTSGTDTHDTLAATKINDPNTYKNARAFLAKHKDIEILRHWTTAPIPGAPAILDHAIGVALDLEWHPENQNHPTPEIDGKITQIGYTVFLMSALSDCRGPADFSTLLRRYCCIDYASAKE
jgi:hypothetical protein